MDVDILKPDTGYLSVIERPSGFSSGLSSNRSTQVYGTPATKSPPTSSEGSTSPVALAAQYTEPLSEGEDEDDEIYAAKGEDDESKRTGLSGAEVKAAIAYRENMLRQARDQEEERHKKERKAGKDRENSGALSPEDFVRAAVQVANGSPAAVESETAIKRPKIQREISSTSKKLQSKALSIDPLAPSTAFDETLKTKLKGAQEQEERRRLRRTPGKERSSSRPSRTHSRSTSVSRYGRRNDQVSNGEENVLNNDESGVVGRSEGDSRILERNWKAPRGKKIAVPVRVEPKVYFAAERTFLVSLLIFMFFSVSSFSLPLTGSTLDSILHHDLVRFCLPDANQFPQKWLNNAVFIGTIATTLLNFIPPEDTRGLISAALFTFAALLAIAYSAGIFIYRSYKLRKRDAEGLYYDKYGPTVLCGVLFLALATNIGLRWPQM